MGTILFVVVFGLAALLIDDYGVQTAPIGCLLSALKSKCDGMKIVSTHRKGARIAVVVVLACLGSAEAWSIKVDPPLALNYRSASITPTMFPFTKENLKQDWGNKIVTTSPSRKLNGLKPRLLRLLVQVHLHFNKPLHIVSGCRNKGYNRRIGGARRSQHLHCNAVDFHIPGVSKRKLTAYLKRMLGRGGVGVYCRSSYVHLDIGPRRQWYWPCRKRKK